MLNLTWQKCKPNDANQQHHWCSFVNLDLDNLDVSGVYIVWLGKSVVYVGQGDVAARLAEHRVDDRFLEYDTSGMLVTWASVPSAQQDGVERYLADTWPPLIGKVWPNAVPITVNSPWG